VIHVTKVRQLTLQAPSSPERHRHLSAASGLVFAGDYLYVVADDEQSLGVFPAIGDAAGALMAIFSGELPATSSERKARKPDLEALTRLPPFPGYPDGGLFALPSGSRPNRRTGALIPLDARGGASGPPRLADRLRLLQRGGSRRHAENAWIDLILPEVLHAIATANSVDHATLVGTQIFDLGTIDGIPLAFTDGAALPDGSIMFTAVAEDADNSYDDGPCVGAAVGMAGNDGRLRFLERLDPTYKVEGIDARVEGDMITLLLVTDSDDENMPASLLAGEIPGHTP
jgi:hypothetical protein